jgi:hypothetical protein
MEKKKIVKSKYIRARVTESRLKDIKRYCFEHNVTASKLINGFFDELLKDKLKD